MTVDWNSVLTTLGSTTVIAAAIVWLVKAFVGQGLHRDLANHKEQLTRESDRARIEWKATYDRDLAEFQAQLSAAAAQTQGIREEVERWANPILGAVYDLRSRLDNILKNEGYPALSQTAHAAPPAGWSIEFAYFFPSTVFVLAQYFCCIRLLQERLRFDLFRHQKEKDAFLARIRSVGKMLSSWPLAELEMTLEKDYKNHPDKSAFIDEIRAAARMQDDRQVFNLQQRAIGEAMMTRDGKAWRCLRLAEFMERWNDPAFSVQFAPLTSMLTDLHPAAKARWLRFKLMHLALGELAADCGRLLQPPAQGA